MCGIVGTVAAAPGGKSQYPEAQQAADIAAGMAALAHRGPDGQRQCSAGGVALGHTRLAIIDLAGGAQPLISSDGRQALVANGEIYNHVEVRAELEAVGCDFLTHSDCEVILQGYRVWGRDVLTRIEGMYAFALHDRERGEVLLARDPLGMKPLFVAASARGVAFASEIKALLALGAVNRDLDPMAIAQYFEGQHPLGGRTPFAGVERLLPGEAMVVDGSGVRERFRHWTLNAVSPRAPADPVAELDALMATVFTQHLRSDVPIGLFLSGGVDSTILLGLMRRYGVDDITTFSLGFPDSSVGDELDTAAQLARHFNTRHHVITPDADTMLGRLVETVWAADDLMRDAASLPTSLLAQHAAEAMKVVFSGEGGDEVFAGYGRYRTGALERRFKGLLWPGTGGFRARGDLRGPLAAKLLGPALMATRGGWREPLEAQWAASPASWSVLQRMQGLDLVNALPDNLLVKGDRMLMAHGVEGRMPFVDRRVVEFGFALPDALKRDQQSGKKVLKDWAATFMPAEHFARKKRGFHVPIRDWWQGDRLTRLGAVLASSPAVQDWLAPGGVDYLVGRQSARSDVGRQLMAVLQFAIWHRLFVEADGARPPADVDPLEFLMGRC